MQGSKFLKVTGILMIIGGALALILAIAALSSVAALSAIGINIGILWFAAILSLVGAVIELVAGIVGVVNWNKLHKSTSCIVWGILVIVLCVVSNVTVFAVDSASFNALSLLTGLVLPVLYLIGAFKNKNAANSVAAGGSNFGANNFNGPNNNL